MSVFWKRKQHIQEEHDADEQSHIQVLELKRRADQTARQADREIKQVKSRLEANGITLRIHIASGGHHGK